MIENQRTGILADPFDTEALAHGIFDFVTFANRRQASELARERAVRMFAPQFAAAQYSELYQSLINRPGNQRLCVI
jgi:glycosyltransferase involved in cell wall biosynthesis